MCTNIWTLRDACCTLVFHLLTFVWCIDVAVGLYSICDICCSYPLWYCDHDFFCVSYLSPKMSLQWINLNTHTRSTALFTEARMSGSGISWAICKFAPCSKQITTPAPHHSVFYRPDALPDTQPTASKHCNTRHWIILNKRKLSIAENVK